MYPPDYNLRVFNALLHDKGDVRVVCQARGRQQLAPVHPLQHALLVALGHQHDLLGRQDGLDAQGQRVLGRWGVAFNGGRAQLHDPRLRSGVARRLVECDVAVLADSQNAQVHLLAPLVVLVGRVEEVKRHVVGQLAVAG